MAEAVWASSIKWLYTILVDENSCHISRRTLLNRLLEKQIQTRPLWQPLHLSLIYRNSFRCGGNTAEQLYQRGLSFPCSVGLNDIDQIKINQIIRNIYLNCEVVST